MGNLEELMVELGFEFEPKALEEFKKGMDSALSMFKILGAGAIILKGAIAALLVTTNAASDSQGKLAGEIDDNVESIDALSTASILAGSSAAALEGTMKGLAKTASEAARGLGSGVEGFGLLGIEVTKTDGKLKNSTQLLIEVAGALEGLERQTQIELADKLGLGGSIRLLQLGRNELSAMVAEMEAIGTTTSEDAKLAAEFNDSFTKMWAVLRQVSRLISRILSPAVTALNTALVDWWKSNRKLIEQNLPKYIEGVTAALKIMVMLIGTFMAIGMVSRIVRLASAMKALSASTMLFNVALAVWPAVLTALIVGLSLVVEDFITYLKGGDSVLGDMFAKFPEYNDELQMMVDIFVALSDVVNKVFDGWKMLFDLFENTSFDDFKELLKNLPGFGKYILESAGEALFGSDAVMSTSSLNSGELSSINTSNSNRTIHVENITVSLPDAKTDRNGALAFVNMIDQAAQDLSSMVVA